jgi:hypothetical protein
VRRRLAAATLFAASLLTAGAGVAGATEPVNLELFGGPGWHSENDFSLHWLRDTRDPSLVTNTHYVILEGTQVIEEHDFPGNPGQIHHLRVPGRPGAQYYGGIRLDGQRTRGPLVTVPLLFDDKAPAPPRLLAPTGWVGASTDASVELEPSSEPAPPSGLRGYAISLNRGPVLPPCAGAVTCSAAETDVGPDARRLPFALSEGIYSVGVVAVSGSGVRSELAVATLRVDGSRPDVSLTNLPTGWSPQPVPLTAVAEDPLAGMAPAGPDGPFTAIAVDGGAPKRAAGARVGAVVAGDGVHSVAFWARDALGNSGEPGVSLAPPATATVRIDGTDPEVAFFRGQDPADPERIEATVADGLSGPDPDRGTIGVRAADSGSAFEPLPTAVAGAHLTARWSSDDYPPGRYEFRATGFDRAGNPGTSTTRAGGAAMVLAAPLKAPVTLEFGFGGRKLVYQRCGHSAGRRRCHRRELESFAARPALRKIPCCHGIAVGGRLLSAAGAPLRDRELEVVETFAAGSHPRVHRTAVRSDDDGSFVTRVSPGPSRRFTVGFAGDPVLSRAAGRELRLAVRTGVHFEVSTSRASIGGAPVVFSGWIAHPGAAIPRAGLPVQLQFRLPGRPWEEFRTLQTNAAGRFRFPYSFTDDDSAGVRFQLRAHTPPSGGWPFLPGTSRPLAVTGH